jgi:hypothetical protein
MAEAGDYAGQTLAYGPLGPGLLMWALDKPPLPKTLQ